MTRPSLNRLLGAPWFVAALLLATTLMALAAMEISVQTENYQRGLFEASSYDATFDYSRAQIEIERLGRSIERFQAGTIDRSRLEAAFAVVMTRLDTIPAQMVGRPFLDAVAARDALAMTCDELQALLPVIAERNVADRMVARLDEIARTFSRLATVANAIQGDIVEGWRTRLSESLGDLGFTLRLLFGIGLVLVVVLIQQKLRFRRQALTDPLTGLPNRASFKKWSPRVAGAKEIAIAVVDIDLFKEVNDSCGHQRGDQLLCDLGAIFQAVTARCGEDRRRRVRTPVRRAGGAATGRNRLRRGGSPPPCASKQLLWRSAVDHQYRNCGRQRG